MAAVWLVAIFLALAVHALIIWLRPFLVPAPAAAPMPVQTVDPKKLEAIRRQWRDQDRREKQLLMNRDQSLPRDPVAPLDSRYLSDRNIRVEKEQRARETSPLAKPKGDTAQSRERSDQPRPRLSDLGVRMPAPPSQATREGVPEGGAQYIDDPSLSVGSENLLNAKESVYYSFYARIYDAIAPVWQSRIRSTRPAQRLMPREYVTVVDIVLDREGYVVDVRFLEGSGVREFDEAVEHAWRAVKRFPNPPQALLDTQSQVHMAWTFVIHAGGGGFQYLPPSRAR